MFTEDMHFLTWNSDKQPNNPETANYFVIYRFRNGEGINIEDANKIVKTTSDNFYIVPYENGNVRYTYAITAVDAFHNESKEVKIKVKQ